MSLAAGVAASRHAKFWRQKVKPGAQQAEREEFPEVKEGDFQEMILEAFRTADDSNNGALDSDELNDMWIHILPGMSSKEVADFTAEIYNDLDKNKDQQIGWDEIEEFFFPDPAYFTAVDAMIHEHILSRAPTQKEAIWFVFDIDTPQYKRLPEYLRPCKKVTALVSNTAILTSIINFVVESALPPDPSGVTDYGGGMFITEAVCITIFTLEFLVRVFATPSQRSLWTNFYTWVDVLAILPFYVSLLMLAAQAGNNPSGALVVLRVLRLLRLLRLLKLGRSFEAVQVLIISVGRTLYPLAVSVICINAVAVLLFASLLVSAEQHEAVVDPVSRRWVRQNDSQWEDAGQEIMYQSIPIAMWWAWVTITTVGYGDMYPQTGPGKAVASVCMLCGLILLTFPLTLLSGSFNDTMEELNHKKSAKRRSQLFREKLLRKRRQQLQGRLGRKASGRAGLKVERGDGAPQRGWFQQNVPTAGNSTAGVGAAEQQQGRESMQPLRPSEVLFHPENNGANKDGAGRDDAGRMELSSGADSKLGFNTKNAGGLLGVFRQAKTSSSLATPAGEVGGGELHRHGVLLEQLADAVQRIELQRLPEQAAVLARHGELLSELVGAVRRIDARLGAPPPMPPSPPPARND